MTVLLDELIKAIEFDTFKVVSKMLVFVFKLLFYKCLDRGAMKKILLLGLIGVAFSANAESYTQSKNKVRNTLVACLKDPENLNFSAASNGCLLEASENFLNKASIEFKSQYEKAGNLDRQKLLNDRKIYLSAVKFCEIYQNVSHGGFTEEAICKVKRAKEYLNFITNGEASLALNWKIEDRVDKLFIGY